MERVIERGPHRPVRYVAAGSRTVGEMFRRRAAESATAPAYYEKEGGAWRGTTWRQFHDAAAAVAAGLLALGLEPGERVSIIGPTRGTWCVLDMGAQLAGLVSVGIYPHQAPEGLRYIIDHSDSRVVFASGEAELANVLEAVRGNDKVVAVVPWEADLAERMAARDPRVTPLDRFRGAPLPSAGIEARLAARDPEDTAIFIYTSGTTGPPKAAMISHRNIVEILARHDGVVPLYQDDVSFSFLPLAHAAERVLGFYGRINAGIATAFASSIAAVLDEVKEIRPTLFGSVPRIFEKAYARIQSEVEKAPPARQRVFRWAEARGRERVRRWQAGERIPLWLRLQTAVADRLVFSRIREAFGGQVRHFITGAAPLSMDILEFFWAAGLPIYEVYGMTEATVVTHANRPGAVKLGTVGRPIPPMEQRIAEDGEILVRGPWVFKGYFKNEEATRATIVDGWLHTGDIGNIDGEGYLRITDRKKHLIITAGGKNLTPANIEQAIKNEDPLISQVHAHGDRRPYVSALIAPAPLETLAWGRERELLGEEEVARLTGELMANPAARSPALEAAMARVVAHPDFRARVREAVRRGNRKLAHVETVRRFALLDRDFSQEHGEMTPTMKVKRKAIEEKFAALFDRIYEEAGFAVEV